jgi:hypothetical protein
MDRVEQIQAAIESLPPAEYQQIAEWFSAHEQARWDAQLDQDSSSGKLDFLFEEADRESAQRTLRQRPPRP